jgi:hypothetical protein
MEEYEGTTAVSITKEKKSTFQKGWDTFAEKTGVQSVFSKLQGLKQTPVYKKGEEALVGLYKLNAVVTRSLKAPGFNPLTSTVI